MKRILIVDDDRNILESAKDILEDAGYAVETAGSVAEARSALAAAAFDLLMVDFNLPDGKGPTLARDAKTLRAGLIAILMTGEIPAPISADAGLFEMVLTKPVDPATLLALLSAYDATSNPPA